MKHKLMEAIRQRVAATELSDRMEVDDAYLGGASSAGKAGRASLQSN